MSRRTSAAGRLLSVIESAQAVGETGSVLNVWASVFGLQPSENALIYRGVARMYELLEEAKSEVIAHPDLDQNLCLGTLNLVETALKTANSAPDNAWVNSAHGLKGPTLLSLGFVANQLDTLSVEEPIDPATLKDLTAQLEAVIASVVDSDFDPILKRVLVEKLEGVRSAIVFYKLDGADGLRRAAENAMGAAVIAANSAKTSKARERVFADYLDVMNHLFELVAHVQPYLPLVHRAIGLLLPGS